MVTPPPNQKDPYRDDHDLDSAKRRLSEIRGRPFDVNWVLAKDRAQKEREFEVRRNAEATLAEARKDAWAKRHEIAAAHVGKERE